MKITMKTKMDTKMDSMMNMKSGKEEEMLMNKKRTTSGIEKVLIGMCVIVLVLFGAALVYSEVTKFNYEKLLETGESLESQEDNLYQQIEAEREEIGNLKTEINTLITTNGELEVQITELEGELEINNEKIELLGGTIYE